jgi:hypothetical protein
MGELMGNSTALIGNDACLAQRASIDRDHGKSARYRPS